MKLKHIPNIFTTNIHIDTRMSERPYADRFKIKDVAYSLIQKRQDAQKEFNKAKWQTVKPLIIVSLLCLVFLIGFASLSLLSDMSIGNKYAMFLMLPAVICFIIIRVELNDIKKKRHSPGYLELISTIEQCNKEIAGSLSVPNESVRVDIIVTEIKYKNGKKSFLYEPELHIKPCHIYKEGEDFLIALEGCIYRFSLFCIHDFVLDERGFGFYDKSNITQRKRDLFQKYEITHGSRRCDYVTAFAPNLVLDIDGYAYKITFMSYEDKSMGEFFQREPRDPTINKEY